MKKIAISVGDVNGISLHQIIKAHDIVKKIVSPIYCVDSEVLKSASKLLNIPLPQDMQIKEINGNVIITPQKVTASSGEYSFQSLTSALKLVQDKKADALCTMPINKYAWSKANIDFKGHTDFLGKTLNKEPLMMLGCDKLKVALVTDHMRLSEVASNITAQRLKKVFDIIDSNFAKPIAVLGLNPHASDNGVLGDEEIIIEEEINHINSKHNEKKFYGPFVPDVSFTSKMRDKFKIYICMYHDQGLIPLKTLYFSDSINITLNIGIKRASPDHGTAYDIAYKSEPDITSYINAIKYLSE